MTEFGRGYHVRCSYKSREAAIESNKRKESAPQALVSGDRRDYGRSLSHERCVWHKFCLLLHSSLILLFCHVNFIIFVIAVSRWWRSLFVCIICILLCVVAWPTFFFSSLLIPALATHNAAHHQMEFQCLHVIWKFIQEINWPKVWKSAIHWRSLWTSTSKTCMVFVLPTVQCAMELASVSSVCLTTMVVRWIKMWVKNLQCVSQICPIMAKSFRLQIVGPFDYDGDRTKATVQFPAHKFPYTTSVYYQCNIRLCMLTDDKCHKSPICDRSSRTKRETDSSDDGLPATIEVFSGLYVNENAEVFGDEYDSVFREKVRKRKVHGNSEVVQ